MNKTSNPACEISVVMAAYNAEVSVERAIQSIQSQTFSNFELIIIDDGSCDNTYDIIQAIAEQDPRINVYKNEKNVGLAASLNKAIKLSKTGLIARMDADDEALPNRFEKQIEYLKAHPAIDVLGSSVLTRQGINGPVIGQIDLPTAHEEIVSRIFRKTLVMHPSILIRKNVYTQFGYYNPELRWAEDADLWYRIYDKITWANLPEPLLIYTLKSKLTSKIIKGNLRVKYSNFSRRGLLMKHFPILARDILQYGFISVRQVFNR